MTLTTWSLLSQPSNVLHRYMAALELHDSRIARHAFAPGTRGRAVREGILEELPQQDAWAMLDASTSAPRYQRLRVLDQTRRLALAETYGEWSTHRLTELLLMVQTRASWQIVARAFTRGRIGEPAPEPDPVGEALIRDCLLACTDEPGPPQGTHLADCRYAYAGAGEPVFRHPANPAWDLGWLGVSRKARLTAKIEIVMRGTIAAAKLVRSDRSVRVVNHVLLVAVDGGWKIADLTCSNPLPAG